MSYQVIARKYRPQRFADVVGQEHVTQTLANAIAQNRIAHAYLFVGPRGTGKTTIARIFAKCLNCTGGPSVDFPEDDPRCREITEGRSLDVLEIDGASNRGIEEIRELRETVKYAPASAKFKIYIIDEVHMLTKEAFNALLKTLEEPPAHVKFMFATTEPEKVLATILSRCQRFDLRRIPAALIVKHLGEIAAKENVKIDSAALHAIARGADGGMRDAESTLDQLISFCGNEIVESDVLSMFGLASQGQVLSLAEAVLGGEIQHALRVFNDLARQGKDLARLLSELLGHFRNLLVYQISSGDLELLQVSEAEAASLATQSSIAGNDALVRIMEVLTEGEGRLRDAASKKILIEVTLLKAVQARNAVSLDSVLKQLNDLRGDSGSSSAPAAQPTRAASAAPSVRTPAPAPPAAPNRMALAETPPPVAPSSYHSLPQPVSADGVNELWAGLIEAVGRVSAFTRTYFADAHPVSFAKNILTIGYDPEFSDHLALVDNSKNHTLLQTKLSELGFPNAQIRFVLAEEPPGWRQAKTSQAAPAEPSISSQTAPPIQISAPRPSAAPGTAAPAKAASKPEAVPFNKEDFKNDPLIQKALELFKGQIVEVRS
jgi:DNA polymerase III subunit gamma/tau